MTRRALAIVALALALTGCPAAWRALAVAGQASQWVSTLVDVAEAGAGAYLARHPSAEREAEVRAAVLTARQALAALDAALAASDDVGEHGVVAARASVLRAYGALRDLLASLGVLDARPPDGGAETDAPLPLPLDLPTAAEVEARL